MVSVTESVVLAAKSVVREHDKVATVQIHPPVGSLMPVMVSPAGTVKLRTAELSVSVDPLFTFTVSWSAVSADFTVSGLGAKVTLTVGTTTGCTNAERSKSAYSSISSCALIV